MYILCGTLLWTFIIQHVYDHLLSLFADIGVMEINGSCPVIANASWTKRWKEQKKEIILDEACSDCQEHFHSEDWTPCNVPKARNGTNNSNQQLSQDGAYTMYTCPKTSLLLLKGSYLDTQVTSRFSKIWNVSQKARNLRHLRPNYWILAFVFMQLECYPDLFSHNPGLNYLKFPKEC